MEGHTESTHDDALDQLCRMPALQTSWCEQQWIHFVRLLLGLKLKCRRGRRRKPESRVISSVDVPLRSEQWSGERVAVHTDGAARRNQHHEIRRAGHGGYWCEGHPLNFIDPLQGTQQTNQRAELSAAIETLKREKRQVEIRTDSKYLYDGFHPPPSPRF